jgi:ClpP class serine protease
VFGTEQLASEVANFEAKYGKALAAYIDGQACSAAYWVASQAPKIFLAGSSTEVGCIGTMITLVDDSKMKDTMGVRTVMVRATDSFNKNQAFIDAQSGDVVALQTEILDPLNNAFLAAVKKGRKKAESPLNTTEMQQGVPVVLTGKTYYGKTAIDIGLADEIATSGIDNAIKWVENRTKKMESEAAKAAAAANPKPDKKANLIIGQHLAPHLQISK